MIDPALLTKVGREADTKPRTSQTWINSLIAADWLDLDKHVAWHASIIVDAVYCRKNDEGWLMILKGYKRKKALVAFVQALTLSEAYELTGEFAKRGCLTWQEDDWVPKWRGTEKP